MNTGLNFKLNETPLNAVKQQEKEAVLSLYNPKHAKPGLEGFSGPTEVKNVEVNTGEVLKLKPLDEISVSKKETLPEKKEWTYENVQYIPKGKKRWKHIFNFAESYETILKKECRDFYKNHPEKFKNERKSNGQVALSFGVATCALMGLGFYLDPSKSIGMAGFKVAAIAISLLSLIVFLGFGWDWLNMKIKGAEKIKLSPRAFLRMFENNKNLRALWYKEEFNETLNSVLLDKIYGKKFKKNPEMVEEINAYCETKKWLKQWSRGDINNLHWVEWQALKGISRKYKRFLTPVDEDLKEEEVSD